MATGDMRINFYLKKFLSVDQVDSNWFQYLLARLVDVLVRLFPQSGIWEPWPFAMTGGTVNDTFTLAGGSDAVLMDDVANLLEIDGAYGTDILFENATGIDYYVGAKYIEIPDEPETNPRYDAPQWKLIRDAVGELADPDSITDQGGGIFRFVVNSVTESGVDHSGRVCRIYLKTPVDLGDNYLEATIAYSGGNNYVDLSTGGALGDISTDETLYSAVVEGYTWKRNTDLSTLPEYAFVGVVTGNGPGAIPTVFNISGQYRLDSSILSLTALITAFQLEHYYSPGSGDHSDITADSIASKAAASLGISADSALGLDAGSSVDVNADTDVIIDIDHDDDESDRVFKVTHDNGAEDLLIIDEETKRTRSNQFGFLVEDDNLFFRIFPVAPSTAEDYLRYEQATVGTQHKFPAPVDAKYSATREMILIYGLDSPDAPQNVYCQYFDKVNNVWTARANPFTATGFEVYWQPHAIQRKNGEIVCVAYNGRTTGPAEFTIWFTKSTDNGVSWSSPVRVFPNYPTGGGSYKYPSITELDNGDLLVAAQNEESAIQDFIVGSISTDGGATWGSPFVIHDPTNPAYPARRGFAYQIPGGDVLCALVSPEKDGSNYNVLLKRSTNGSTWGVLPDVEVTKDTTLHEYPSLFYNTPTGELYCVYMKTIGGTSNLMIAVSFDGGYTWIDGRANDHIIDDSGATASVVGRASYWPGQMFGVYAGQAGSAYPGILFFKLLQTLHVIAHY